MKNFLFFFVILCLGPACKAQESAYIEPIDEGPLNPSFVEFRRNFIRALRVCNSETILHYVDSKVHTSLGIDDGLAYLKEKLKGKKAPLFCHELLKTVSLGGKFTDAERDEFIAPYVFSSFPDERFTDPGAYAVVIGRNVNIRENPSLNGKVLSKVSHAIIQQTTIESNKWIQVQTLDGTKGYIHKDFVRSPLDYRIVFKYQNGKWIITVIIAGE
jgi:hypothetical protein